MASEKIDELLVGLGLDADKASFDQGIGMFNNVRTAALSLAGVLATSFGAKTVMNFAQQADQAGRMADNLNVSTGYLRQLGFAFSQVGGSTQDAISDIQTLRGLMDEVQTNPGGDTFALMAAMGLDPEGIAMAENVMDAYRLLIERGSALGADQRRIAFGSIGLSQASASLADEGPEFMRQEMEFSKRTAELTELSVSQSREFNRELNRLNSTALGIKDAITMDLIGKLEPLIETINELMGGVSAEDASTFWNYGPLGLLYKKLMGDDEPDVSTSSPPPQASATPSRVDLRRMVAEAERDIGAPRGLLWAQLGVESNYDPLAVSPAGARGLAQMMPKTERLLEAQFGRDLDPFNPVDAIAMQKYMMRENYENSGDWDTALRLYHGGYDRSEWGPENEKYVPLVRDRMRSAPEPQTRDVTFNIYDATDPNKVAQVVDGRLKEMSERAAEDFRTGIA